MKGNVIEDVYNQPKLTKLRKVCMYESDHIMTYEAMFSMKNTKYKRK